MSNSIRTRFWVLAALTAAGAVGYAAAYRFALQYRERAGLPHRSPVESSPEDFGLAFERVEIPSGSETLAGWFVPAAPEPTSPERRRGRRAESERESEAGPRAADATGTAALPHPIPADRRPGIVVVHGWESNRGRTFAHARYLHAAGFHCLVFDVRGHGDNPPETLPMNVPEFAEDTMAAARWLGARPEVSAVGVLGHSLGGAGAIVAAASEPLIGALVAASSPSDIVRITRKTFGMADMHIPEPVAVPLARIVARTLLAPRGRSLADASAMVAVRRYRGPLLLTHGAQDKGVPVEHLELIARSAVASRDPHDPPVETLVLPEFGHRWLYESPEFRRRVARFFAGALGGPVSPDEAAERAAACAVERPADPIYGFGALEARTPPG
jgi:alpha-beta hydrolase superfamily lysophospholipase